MESSFAVNAFVSVCTKVIALCLQQIGGHVSPPVAIKIGQRRTERWNWQSQLRCGIQHTPPSSLCAIDRFSEVRMEKEIL